MRSARRISSSRPSGPVGTMAASCGATSSIGTRTARTAGCSRPTGATTRWSLIRASSRSGPGAPRRGGKRPVAVLLTHAHVDHARPGGRVRGRRRCPSTSTRPTPWRSGDPELWNPGFANPFSEVKDLRTVADGDVLRRSPASRIEVEHTPGHTPGHCCFRDGRVRAVGRPGVRGFDRPLGLPELVARRIWSAACDGSSSFPTSCRCCPATGRTRRVGRERATNPFLRGLA